MIPTRPLGGAIPLLLDNPIGEASFRILGLASDATAAAVEARARGLLAGEGLSGAPVAEPGWLPPLVRDPEQVLATLRRLASLRGRIWQRLLWFGNATPLDVRAFQALEGGRVEEAVSIWRKAMQGRRSYRASACHNLALLFHSRALAAPRGAELARRDMEEARGWWSRIFAAGVLPRLAARGEVDPRTAEEEAHHCEEDFTQRIRDLLEPSLLDRLPSAGAPQRPFKTEGDWDLRLSRPGEILAALEEAEDAVRRGDRQAFSDWAGRARDLCPTPTEHEEVDQKVKVLARRMACRGLKPVTTPPVLSAHSGLGTVLTGMSRPDPETRSYEASLVFIFGHVPLVPLGRYRVAQREDGSHEFLGRVPLDGWLLAQRLLLAGVLVLVLWAAGGVGPTPMSASLEGSRALRPLTYSETEALRRAPGDLARRIQEVDAALEALASEQAHLKRVRIPPLERQVEEARLAAGSGELGLLARRRERALQSHRERLARIGREIQEGRQLRRRLSLIEGGAQ